MGFVRLEKSQSTLTSSYLYLLLTSMKVVVIPVHQFGGLRNHKWLRLRKVINQKKTKLTHSNNVVYDFVRRLPWMILWFLYENELVRLNTYIWIVWSNGYLPKNNKKKKLILSHTNGKASHANFAKTTSRRLLILMECKSLLLIFQHMKKDS